MWKTLRKAFSGWGWSWPPWKYKECLAEKETQLRLKALMLNMRDTTDTDEAMERLKAVRAGIRQRAKMISISEEDSDRRSAPALKISTSGNGS